MAPQPLWMLHTRTPADRTSAQALVACRSELVQLGAQQMTLGSYLSHLDLNASKPCSQVDSSQQQQGCKSSLVSHTLSYTHGEARIHVHLHKTPGTITEDGQSSTSQPLSEPTSKQAPSVVQAPVAQAWLVCRQCWISSNKTHLLSKHLRMQLGPYLETILYASHFVKGLGFKCDCNPDSTTRRSREKVKPAWWKRAFDYKAGFSQLRSENRRSDLVHCFQVGSHTITFHYEPITLYNTALPMMPRLKLSETVPDVNVEDTKRNAAIAQWKKNINSFITLTDAHYKQCEDVLKSEALDSLNKQKTELKELIEKWNEFLIASNDSVSESLEQVAANLTMRYAIQQRVLSIWRSIDQWQSSYSDVSCPLPSFKPTLPSCRFTDYFHLRQRLFFLVAHLPFAPDHQQPMSLISLALQAQPVLDLIHVLSKLHFENEKPLLNLKPTEIQQVFTQRCLPQRFESTSLDNSVQLVAELIDGHDIRFTYKSLSKSSQSLLESFQVTIHFALAFHMWRQESLSQSDRFDASLCECTSWQPTGGKSASRFFTTQDQRFIIKQIGLRRRRRPVRLSRPISALLQDAAEVKDVPGGGVVGSAVADDKEVVANETERRMVLEVSHKYLDYVLKSSNVGSTTSATTETPSSASNISSSALVKTFGVFRLRYKTNTMAADDQMEMNFVVMENLFFGRQIAAKFDLKGIQSRRVNPASTNPRWSLLPTLQRHMSAKWNATNDDELTSISNPPSDPDQTLWDGNWLTSLHQRSQYPSEPLKTPDNQRDHGRPAQQHAVSTLFLHPRSKLILKQALEKDTAFMKDANVIDYSLLVGIDEEKGELVLGLVDYFCEYDIWKRLESHGKTTLKMLERTMHSIHRLSLLSLSPSTSTSMPVTEKPSISVQPSLVQSLLDPMQWISPRQSIVEDHPVEKPLPLTPAELCSQSAPIQPTSPRETVDTSSLDAAVVTVQPPEKYRNRFLKAMNDYFLMVPDPWTNMELFKV